MLNSIHSDLIRGHIDTIILSVLHEGDRYGYDILGEIERKSDGNYALKQPTLYSCLKRLESQGFIYKYWGSETNGGRRTYYSLTDMGKELFLHNKDEWKHSRFVIDKLISTADDPSVEEAAAVKDSSESPLEEVAATAEVIDSAESEAVPEEQFTESLLPTVTEEIPTEAVGQVSESEIAATETETETVYSSNDSALNEEYAAVLANAEKDEILSENTDNLWKSKDAVKGVSYADRLAHDNVDAEKRIEKDNSNMDGIPFFAGDYFKDNDEDDDEDEFDDESESNSPYPSEAFYKDEDFSREEDSGQLSMFADSPSETEKKKTADNSTINSSNNRGSVFKSYDNAELSEETNREIVVGREYLGVIKRLLRGDDADADTYYSRLREVGATVAVDGDEREQRIAADDRPSVVTETQPPMESSVDGANFDDLLVSVRSMGDDIRIRTHNRSIDKEYNSLYHYYSNKLLLFKYGILFALMILETVIPYFVIKFVLNLSPIVGELPVLVISVMVAALLPIYAISAFLIDPYKRKRFDFDLKNSLLYRLGIMLLMLILVYAVNVVFYMDISLEIEYAFSLVTPALLTTNIPISALVFKGLYNTKRFSVE